MRTRRPVALALEDMSEVTAASSAGDLTKMNMGELWGKWYSTTVPQCAP
jgi:hypothetical protein